MPAPYTMGRSHLPAGCAYGGSVAHQLEGPFLYCLVGAGPLAPGMIPVGCAPLDAFYQTCVEPDKQGRVFAVLVSIDRLTMPLGLVIGGAVGPAVPLNTWWGLAGLSHFLLGVAWLLMPIIRVAEDKKV